jgi:hypothetical protein
MLKTRLAAIGASALLVASGAVLAQPAQAASTIVVCNSPISWTRIAATGWGFIGEGNCSGALPNGSNQVRVDTDPDGPSHSYWTTYDNLPHGSCHTDSDNHSSDPSNYAKVTYRNFDHGNCTN